MKINTAKFQGTHSPVTASVTKAKLSEPTGLILDSSPSGTIRISGIKYGSLFWSKGLKNGYQVLSINGISCESNMTVDAATTILQNSKDVTIVAIDDGKAMVNKNPTVTDDDLDLDYGGVAPPMVEAKMVTPDEKYSTISPTAPQYEEADIECNPMEHSPPSTAQPPVYVPPSSKPQGFCPPSSPMRHSGGLPGSHGSGINGPPLSSQQKIRISNPAPPMPRMQTPIAPVPNNVPNDIPNQVVRSSFPPPGVADGGVWGKTKEIGDQTWIVCVILALLTGVFSGCGTAAFCCPCDEKDAYKVNGKIFNASGQCIGTNQNKEFRPLPRHQQPGASAISPAPQAAGTIPQPQQVAPGTVTENVTMLSDGSRQTVRTTYNFDGSKTVKTTIQH